ncbi:orotidine-5'-phosphate decarboxylase [Virgibacillus profundi]|uniref:Orotidine 5'-phosphate decarboxylase n=1 Tax=Virgibacillus profundi TaxID=2024555 RepID=A0A2A2IF15_9BACI|nr:orotidine-5'-phosphate decarboxylase [Virgibacillus profundi]PAV29938.1 orotidine-5'-phosphate decarboxylase [Virgibacillus profundi]PXY54110.1 orotidine-5'-phosphate decarboxylase [Virgibacillus profundi]
MSKSIYLALDFPTWEKSRQFLISNNLEGVPVKVGMELFYREGPGIIEKLKENNHPIFLDLKLHDIPTTVMKAMSNLAKLEVDMVNVHALGGSEMIKRAKEGLIKGSKSGHQTKLIAVTILTSMDNETMNHELLLPGDLDKNTIHFAKMAKQSGADGVVCSVHEVLKIKQKCGSTFSTVTPGIRLQTTSHDDQKRVSTPGFARENGADLLVIGRSVTQAVNPYEAYQQAVKEWEADGITS